MNAGEFILALFAVFGSTGVIFAWNKFVYSLEESQKEAKNDRSLDILS